LAESIRKYSSGAPPRAIQELAAQGPEHDAAVKHLSPAATINAIRLLDEGKPPIV
jgi:hypothetical protein